MLNEKEVLHGIVKRVLAHLDAGTTDSAAAPYRHPTWTYTDPALFEQERLKIFKENPQLVGFSPDLPQPGSFFTFDDLGVPVLLVRDNEGKVNAFLNACSHRGARLKEGCGKAASLSCPYHAWGFDLKGKLRTIFKEESFGCVDKAYYNLVKLPVEEKYGMIFVGLDPDMKFSIDDHLGDLAQYFAMWDFSRMNLVDTHEWHLQTNWKLALDTFCEGYHFGPLHKDSVGDYAIGNLSLFDRFGPGQRHHRVAFPNTSIGAFKDLPEEQWTDVFSHFQLVHFIYPNISMLVSPTAVEFFQLYPGPTVDSHVTRYRCYWRSELDRPDQGRDPQAHFEFIREVVDKEDYWVSANVQKSLSANIKPFSTFGRNEPALINMHQAFLRGVGITPEQAQLEKVGA
ncbi:Rieske 2Fe-2S domain-containing protein [Pseudoduganella sp. LjRoot289]|uniref:aromatic ring-hydroxylating oxygenase subunit alpha n=1 Tax=Pseudoduganella sp. LjRoot289 TaxID=3342314 RepID=UPI003ECCBE15